MKLVFVHGINNEDNSCDIIRIEWQEALKNGCQKHGVAFPNHVEIVAAFYGDVLAAETDNWSNSTDRLSQMSADNADLNTVTADHGAFYQEFQKELALSENDLDNYLSDDDALTPQAAGIHKKWLKAITRALEKVLPTKGRYVARLFLKQAAAYLHKPGLKEQIDDLVEQQIINSIREEHKTVIVAHSLGTIVAYDLLRRLHGSGESVDLFLTAGSPLGIEIVKKKLGAPIFMPASIKNWVNATDPEDFVALKNELNANTFGSVTVSNFTELDNGDVDAHDIRQYLQQKVVVEAIVAALTN